MYIIIIQKNSTNTTQIFYDNICPFPTFQVLFNYAFKYTFGYLIAPLRHGALYPYIHFKSFITSECLGLLPSYFREALSSSAASLAQLPRDNSRSISRGLIALMGRRRRISAMIGPVGPQGACSGGHVCIRTIGTPVHLSVASLCLCDSSLNEQQRKLSNDMLF